MRENTTYVRNIKKYLLAALYNAPATIDSYYTSLVSHDMYGGGDRGDVRAGRNHPGRGLSFGGDRQDDADLLQKGCEKGAGGDAEEALQRSLHQGKQTLHQLKQHGASLTNIEITEQNIKAFSAVAKKYDIGTMP